MERYGFIPVALVLFWAGFVSSISFMEAWLKFQAAGVTLPLGLSIGKKVFTALNRVEWFFLGLFVIYMLLTGLYRQKAVFIVSSVPAAVLLVQTFVLLPELVERANRIIQGNPVEDSFFHIAYVVFEVLKVGSLFFLGHLLYKYKKGSIKGR